MEHLLKNKKFLFIGGAPRSGTTLITQLLDGHSKFIVFPFEHSSIEQYFRNSDNRSFFLDDFINRKEYGQQVMLANESLLSNYYSRLENEYGKSLPKIEINTKDFKKGYLKFLNGHDINLENILKALIAGLVKGANIDEGKITKAEYLVFKNPFYTELFAQFIADNLDDASFIHIIRKPVNRYASAKSRRLSTKGQSLSRLNKFNFTFGHTLIDIATNFLKEKNLKKLGVKSYIVVDFDKMIDKNEIIFKDVCNYLEIKYDNKYFKTPTVLGNKTIAGSKHVKDDGVDKKVNNRGNIYQSVTNSHERLCHSYFLYKAKLSNEKINTFQFMVHNSIPHRFCSIKNYVSQLMFLFYFWNSINDSSIKSFLKDIADGKKGISGIT